MPLGAILESDFWNTYIKKGNVLLVSKGQLDADNIFTLNDGILRMSLDNEAYERAGLQGRQAKFANQPGLMKRRRFCEDPEISIHIPELIHKPSSG